MNSKNNPYFLIFYFHTIIDYLYLFDMKGTKQMIFWIVYFSQTFLSLHHFNSIIYNSILLRSSLWMDNSDSSFRFHISMNMDIFTETDVYIADNDGWENTMRAIRQTAITNAS